MAKTKVTIKQPDFSKWKQAIQDLTVKTGLKIEETAKEHTEFMGRRETEWIDSI